MKSEVQERSPLVGAKKRSFQQDTSGFRSISPPPFSLLAEEEQSSEDLISKNSLAPEQEGEKAPAPEVENEKAEPEMETAEAEQEGEQQEIAAEKEGPELEGKQEAQPEVQQATAEQGFELSSLIGLKILIVKLHSFFTGFQVKGGPSLQSITIKADQIIAFEFKLGSSSDVFAIQIQKGTLFSRLGWGQLEK